MHILNKRQQSKDSTLQNGILGQSTKNTDIFVFSFEWFQRDCLRIVAYTENSFV